MTLFTNPAAQERFLGLMTSEVSAQTLANAIQYARKDYIDGLNHSEDWALVDSWLLLPGWRAFKLYGRDAKLPVVSDKISNAKQTLYDILSGEGGCGIHSFKWILTQHLSVQIHEAGISGMPKVLKISSEQVRMPDRIFPSGTMHIDNTGTALLIEDMIDRLANCSDVTVRSCENLLTPIKNKHVI